MFVMGLYFVHHTVCASMTFVAFMFSTDTPLPSAAKQLLPTTYSPHEAFTTGMYDVHMVLYNYSMYTLYC